ncbi:MAG: hypothetical protein ABI835_01570 [Chloroflexota bacterium]
MRGWWRNWAKFDIIALGAGILLSVLYIWVRDANPGIPSSPYFELWSNIAGGILGAWISVRLLDTLIQAREKREQVRKNLLSNLNYISAEARRLLPKVYDFNLVTLEDELVWSRKRYPKRQQYLHDGERSLVEAVSTSLDLAIQTAKTYVQADKEVRASRYQADVAVNQVNEAVAMLEKQLRGFQEQSPADAAAVSALDTLIAQGIPPLASSDTTEVRAFLATLINPNRASGTYVPVPALNYIRLYDREWIKQVERAYDELRDVAAYNPAALGAILTDARARLKADPLPALVATAIENYLTAVTELGARRTRLETSLNDLTSRIDAAVRDIMEESEFD